MRTIKQIIEKTDYSETQMELFLAECMFDYLYFAEHVFGFDIADYHREWFELAEKFKRLVIVAFRGSGKTHFFAGYFICKIGLNAMSPPDTKKHTLRESFGRKNHVSLYQENVKKDDF